jgi:hypothetical protein
MCDKMWHITIRAIRRHPSASRYPAAQDLAAGGRTVELRDRNRVIGRILPENPPAASGSWPDFEDIANEILGDRMVSGSDLLIEERGRY